MPRTRRFALLAVLVLVAGGALAGCGRAQPGTAAYVGKTRYTERQVDVIADQIRRSQVANRVSSPRVAALSWLVLGDLARRAAAERSIAVPASDYASFAQLAGQPADSDMVRAVADWAAVSTAVSERVEPVSPSEADLREIYDILRRNSRLPPTATYDQVANQLRGDPSLPTVIGMRNVMRDVAEKAGMVLNPRYQPLVADLGENVPVPLVLAAESGVVADLPRR